jgi:hypothetical protein
MNALITKLELELNTTTRELDDAVKYSDPGAVLKLTELKRNQEILMGLLKAWKLKKLGLARLITTVVMLEE